MRKLIFILFFIPISLIAQNLVPNPSFEDTLWCPGNGFQINASNHWFSPIGGGGSSELFHLCNCNLPNGIPGVSPGSVCVPSNPRGYQLARTGVAYAGICFYQGSYEYRENIEVQLISELNPIRSYYAEFYVSLIDNASCGIKNIGAYFSNNMLTYAGYHPAMMNLTPHIEYSGSPIIDTMNWVKVSGYFKPDDEGTKYMTIGNFADSGQTVYTKLNNTPENAYYYIDDVFVADSASYVNSLKELEISNQELVIYPNPAKDKLSIEFTNSKQSTIIEVELYNCMGSLVKRLQIKQNESCIDVVDLPQGFYIVAVHCNGKIFARKKVVISR